MAATASNPRAPRTQAARRTAPPSQTGAIRSRTPSAIAPLPWKRTRILSLERASKLDEPIGGPQVQKSILDLDLATGNSRIVAARVQVAVSVKVDGPERLH